MVFLISSAVSSSPTGGVGDKCNLKLKSDEEFVKKEYFESNINPGYMII